MPFASRKGNLACFYYIRASGGCILDPVQLFSARAAFLHVGAMLGTIMAANVFFQIIPGQKKLIAEIRAGGRHRSNSWYRRQTTLSTQYLFYFASAVHHDQQPLSNDVQP